MLRILRAHRGAFQVMARVPGRALLLQDAGPDVGGRAGMQRELLRGFREVAFGPWPRLLAQTHESGLHSMKSARAWLRETSARLPQRLCVCHGDLFPNQVFVSDGRVTGVIDWADALLAPAEVDVSFVYTGVQTVPLPMLGIGMLIRRVARRFLAAYAAWRSVDTGAVRFGEVLRLVRTLVAVGSHRAGCGPEPVRYSSAAGRRNLHRYLTRLGIEGGLG